MSITKLSARISGLSGVVLDLDFLMESGTTYSVLPKVIWKKLGLKPKRRLTFTLADGTSVERNVSECHFQLAEVDGTSPVVLGEAKDVALLGVITRKNLGVVLNPFERTLKPMRRLMV